MFSFQYEIFDDIKARSVLYDKKKKIGYLLTQKDKGKAHCSNRYTDRIPGDHVLSHGSLHTQSIRRGKTVGAVFQYFAL